MENNRATPLHPDSSHPLAMPAVTQETSGSMAPGALSGGRESAELTPQPSPVTGNVSTQGPLPGNSLGKADAVELHGSLPEESKDHKVKTTREVIYDVERNAPKRVYTREHAFLLILILGSLASLAATTLATLYIMYRVVIHLKI